MAYDTFLAERIAQVLQQKKIAHQTKEMMGGLVFMVNEKMFCSLHWDKKREKDLMMARVGFEKANALINVGKCYPMDFTGRPMKDYVFIPPEEYDLEEDLVFWLDLCHAFNDKTKKSKKRKK